MFFGNDLISNPLLYFFDIRHVSIHFSIPEGDVV